MTKKSNRIPFPHPGETIREDYLKPLGMSVNRLAIELRVPATPDAGGRARAEGHYGRYGSTARAVFQYDSEILVESANLV